MKSTDFFSTDQGPGRSHQEHAEEHGRWRAIRFQPGNRGLRPVADETRNCTILLSKGRISDKKCVKLHTLLLRLLNRKREEYV